MARKRIGELLVDVGLITPEDLQQALKEQASSNGRLGDVLINNGYITQNQLLDTLQFQLGIPRVELNENAIDASVLNLVSSDLVRRYQVIPFRRQENRLHVAMADPLDYYAIDDIQMTTGFVVESAIAAREDIVQAIHRYYNLHQSVTAAIESVPLTASANPAAQTNQSDSPVIRLLNQILLSAAGREASDVHLDPQSDGIHIRFRVDGLLRTEQILPQNMHSVLVTRVKVLSNLDIAEQRLPQDGRFRLQDGKYNIDVRVSTMPTAYGEKVVLRILDLNTSLLTMSQLGFLEENAKRFERIISKPYGFVLITGPTGSGKTTTLYAALRKKATPEVNVVTIEDPIEIELRGINQVQVNQPIGLTFARGLRAVLRQDPDIVMIGEIRDHETATISVRAAVTGHLVLSTVHTNDAPSAINRLLDMGVEPYMIASALTGVVAQRLVRKICPKCSQPYEPSPVEAELLTRRGLPTDALRAGRGCGFCANTGFLRRIPIHEVFAVDNEVAKMILAKESDRAYKAYAMEHGMEDMLTDGLQKVASGLTTVQEILRVTALDV